MTAKIDRDSLGLGACFALTHAAQLLEDSAKLYAHKRGSSCFHLAVMAREELGRYHLLGTHRHSLADGQTIDAKEIEDSLRSHVKSFERANSFFGVPFAPGQVRRLCGHRRRYKKLGFLLNESLALCCCRFVAQPGAHVELRKKPRSPLSSTLAPRKSLHGILARMSAPGVLP